METSHTVPRPHDYNALASQLDTLTTQMNWLIERQKKQEELLSEMTPILRAMMDTATERLDTLEKQGYFAFGREMIRVGERIIEGFSPEDVQQLGEAIVRILQTVRALTQPEVLSIAGEASRVLQNAHQAEPLGLVGMVKATRDDNVQRGMAVMLELMRHVGRATQAVEAQRKATPAAQRRVRLAEMTGARKKGAPEPAAPLGPPPACAVPAKPAGAAAIIDGVAFTADGHLVDPNAWSEALADRLAATQGLSLTEAHWAVLRFARADFLQTGVAPNIRRITQGTNLSTRDLYALFPKAPARTVARVAGIPKPAGCI